MNRVWSVFRNRTIQKTVGALLICTSVAAICVWFLWLVPSVRRLDPLWEERFTRKSYWNEVQRHIRRYGWKHDDCVVVGNYGDKTWAEWIMSKAEAGEKIADCGAIGHKDSALKVITGNDPANGKNWDSEAQWLGWWSTNKDKSQLEWIRSGLQIYGASVHLPPSEADYEPLLAFLGNSSTNAAEKIPFFVKYNAFRWLRDAGFQPIAFAMSNVTAQTPKVVRDGVLKYGKFDQVYSKMNEIGRLEFANPPSDLQEGYRSQFYAPKIQIAGYSLMTVPLVAGVALLLCSRARRQKAEQSGSAHERSFG